MVFTTGKRMINFFCILEKGKSLPKRSHIQTVRATGTGLVANERFFVLVSESHQFLVFISFRSKALSDNRWTKSYALGSNTKDASLVHHLWLSNRNFIISVHLTWWDRWVLLSCILRIWLVRYNGLNDPHLLPGKKVWLGRCNLIRQKAYVVYGVKADMEINKARVFPRKIMDMK